MARSQSESRKEVLKEKQKPMELSDEASDTEMKSLKKRLIVLEGRLHPSRDLLDDLWDDDTFQPFTREVRETLVPTRFKQPAFDKYDGSSDPTDHILYLWLNSTSLTTPPFVRCSRPPSKGVLGHCTPRLGRVVSYLSKRS